MAGKSGDGEKAQLKVRKKGIKERSVHSKELLVSDLNCLFLLLRRRLAHVT